MNRRRNPRKANLSALEVVDYSQAYNGNRLKPGVYGIVSRDHSFIFKNVVDSNKNNDLAVVKLYSNGKSLINTNSKYKSFVKTLDNSGNNIRLGKKFILTKKRLSKLNVSIIKKRLF